MAGTLKEYKINKDINIFKSNRIGQVSTSESTTLNNEANKEIIKTTNNNNKKPSGRPKKEEASNKKIIIYFTENEFNNIAEKCKNIAMSPLLKKIILENLK